MSSDIVRPSAGCVPKIMAAVHAWFTDVGQAGGKFVKVVSDKPGKKHWGIRPKPETPMPVVLKTLNTDSMISAV